MQAQALPFGHFAHILKYVHLFEHGLGDSAPFMD
jgi:hypothetical protein